MTGRPCPREAIVTRFGILLTLCGALGMAAVSAAPQTAAPARGSKPAPRAEPPAPARPGPGGADARLRKSFSAEIRSAPLGDVASQLTRTLGVNLKVTGPDADLRITARAPEATVGDFMRAAGNLLDTSWTASAEADK